MSSLVRTIEQKRATHAWGKIQSLSNKPDGFKKKYNALVKKVPVLILTNGLGQALAFLKAKSKNDDHHMELYRHVSEGVDLQLPLNGKDLLEKLLQDNSTFLRQTTRTALAYLQWLKRFAEAELPAGEEE